MRAVILVALPRFNKQYTTPSHPKFAQSEPSTYSLLTDPFRLEDTAMDVTEETDHYNVLDLTEAGTNEGGGGQAEHL